MCLFGVKTPHDKTEVLIRRLRVSESAMTFMSYDKIVKTSCCTNKKIFIRVFMAKKFRACGFM